jgi:hypothetical protein
MANESAVLPADVNQEFIRARDAISAALQALDDANGIGTPTQYAALVAARRWAANVYREARALNHRSDLDQTLWFALDEAALWQDQEADRYRQLAAGADAP